MAEGMAAQMVAKAQKKKKKKETIDLGEKGKITVKKGALHSQLGIPQGQKIPASTLAAAAQKGGKLGQRARLAETLKGFKH